MTNLVAFPLPDITVDNPGWNVAVPTDDPVNFLAFSTTANGQPVTSRTSLLSVSTGPPCCSSSTFRWRRN